MYKWLLLIAVFMVSYCSKISAESEWTLIPDFKATSVGGVFATDSNTCYAAYTDNDIGPGEYLTKDAGATYTTSTGGSLNTDIAKDTAGNGIMTSIGKILTSTNGVIQNIGGKAITFSQDVENFGEGKFAVAGQHYPEGVVGSFFNGPAITTDAGKTFTYYDTGLDGIQFAARYGAYPTDKTWYIAQGSWVSAGVENDFLNANSTDIDVERYMKSWRANERVTVHKIGNDKHKINIKNEIPRGKTIRYGAISKTTDGGKTFKKVYDTKGEYYMNQISCSTTEICTAVAENPDSALVIRTENGGQTWQTVMTNPESKTDVSLVGCKMLSDDEIWVSGGTFQQGTLGWFFHSTDAGKTWKQYDLPKGYSLDLTFSDGNGYSPALTETGSGLAKFA